MTLRLHGDALVTDDVLDFAVNVWPGGRPPALQAALEDALDGHRYPDARAATAAVARRHGRPAAEALPTNGACEAFWLLAQTLRPRRAVCIHPSFTEPEAALRAAGSEVVHVIRERESWRFDRAAVADDADFVAVCNPNNPTGSLDEADAIVALARPGRVVLVDESFMDFVAGEAQSLAARRDVPGLVVVRSLTKLWSLAGIRAGYLLGPPGLVARLRANRQPWSVNGLACAALVACADDRTTPERVAAEVATARAELVDRLAGLDGIRVWRAHANFLLLQVDDAPAVHERLRRARIAVRPAASFPGLDDSFIRVAVRRSVDNLRLVGALAG